MILFVHELVHDYLEMILFILLDYFLLSGEYDKERLFIDDGFYF